MSYTYTTFQKALALWMAIPNINVNSPNFVAALPSIIDYAEQRCYRELDLISATATQDFLAPAGSNQLSFDVSGALAPSSDQILIPETIGVFLPIGALPTDPGAWLHPLSPVSIEFLDATLSGVVGTPDYFSPLTDKDMRLGPGVSVDSYFHIIGVYRPAPLYSAPPNDGTQTTFLTSVLPDLFLACAMISAAGYQKNFGAQADDPRMAQSWEQQYLGLLKSAGGEELRKKFHGWQALSSEVSPPQTPMPPPGG
jgi:hypothetical protein